MPYFTSQDKLEVKGTILYEGWKKVALFENFSEGNCTNYFDELSALSNIGYQYIFENSADVSNKINCKGLMIKC